MDIGFAFLPEFIGKGFGQEAAAATLRYAKQELQIEKILAITSIHNTASIALLKKPGFAFERRIQLPADEEMLNLFSLGKALLD